MCSSRTSKFCRILCHKSTIECPCTPHGRALCFKPCWTSNKEYIPIKFLFLYIEREVTKEMVCSWCSTKLVEKSLSYSKTTCFWYLIEFGKEKIISLGWSTFAADVKFKLKVTLTLLRIFFIQTNSCIRKYSTASTFKENYSFFFHLLNCDILIFIYRCRQCLLSKRISLRNYNLPIASNIWMIQILIKAQWFITSEQQKTQKQNWDLK